MEPLTIADQIAAELEGKSDKAHHALTVGKSRALCGSAPPSNKAPLKADTPKPKNATEARDQLLKSIEPLGDAVEIILPVEQLRLIIDGAKPATNKPTPTK